MSREALSLDISQVVALVVGGEAVDTAERGQWLATKYPGLGMSAEMIGQAIDRAAGMMGMIKSAPEPVIPRRADPSLQERRAAPVMSGPGLAAPVFAPVPAPALEKTTDDAIRMPAASLPAMPRATLLIDDDLAAAIDAEISGLVIASRKTMAPAATADARGGSPRPAMPRTVTVPSSYQTRERAFPARETRPAEAPAAAAPRSAAGGDFEPRGAVFEPGYPAARAEAERSAFARVRRAFFRH